MFDFLINDLQPFFDKFQEYLIDGALYSGFQLLAKVVSVILELMTAGAL